MRWKHKKAPLLQDPEACNRGAFVRIYEIRGECSYGKRKFLKSAFREGRVSQVLPMSVRKCIWGKEMGLAAA